MPKDITVKDKINCNKKDSVQKKDLLSKRRQQK